MRVAAVMTANRRNVPRDGDFYPTPAQATRALLTFLPRNVRVWEPACGDGAIARVLVGEGYEVIASDLFDRGYGLAGRDFLTSDEPLAEWIVTNPPYRLGAEFAARAISLGRPTALLLKSQFWHAEKRRALFERHRPQYVLPLTWRPDFGGGGAPTMDVAWTVWGAIPSALTEYRPIGRPPAPAEGE